MIKIHFKSIFYPQKAPVNKSNNLGMKIKSKGGRKRKKKIRKGREKGKKEEKREARDNCDLDQ